MAFCAILRKSASSLALTASRHTGANRNYFSAVFTGSSGHLNRKSTLGSFVPDFDFSSATETKKCSSINESLLQAIDSKIKCANDYDHVEETPNEFTMKFGDSDPIDIVLTREYQDELVEVSSPVHDYRENPVMDWYRRSLYVDISMGGFSLEFECYCTSDNAISIQKISILSSEENSKNWRQFYPVNHDNFVEFNDKIADAKLVGRKKIKNIIQQLS
ncbi:hypothetical protein EZV62_025727 [Acer yangbiense]|uniref:Uncharacterized protein n=1 Tax=Acer yangbiense TaxID=1000413 RepID=A0A5C7H010_9ROSI|nr:hypothetical protein EZV62_025727 [Acer yangbiense]